MHWIAPSEKDNDTSTLEIASGAPQTSSAPIPPPTPAHPKRNSGNNSPKASPHSLIKWIATMPIRGRTVVYWLYREGNYRQARTFQTP